MPCLIEADEASEREVRGVPTLDGRSDSCAAVHARAQSIHLVQVSLSDNWVRVRSCTCVNLIGAAASGSCAGIQRLQSVLKMRPVPGWRVLLGDLPFH